MKGNVFFFWPFHGDRFRVDGQWKANADPIRKTGRKIATQEWPAGRPLMMNRPMLLRKNATNKCRIVCTSPAASAHSLAPTQNPLDSQFLVISGPGRDVFNGSRLCRYSLVAGLAFLQKKRNPLR